MPSEEFIYGKKNRTPTPIKDIVGYEYARNAEHEIRGEYNDIMIEVINKFFIIFLEIESRKTSS